jgi:phosphate-selective porin OprO/OprP
MTGFELYYRPGSLMFGSEYFLNKVSSPSTGNPFFHGGEIFAAYTLTGEIRRYNEAEAYFEPISPARPLFSGGPGAFELVLRYSYADLKSGPIDGGRFWRLTPMLNWHMTNNARLEFVYGYGVLDRAGIQGDTQFFQTRLQLII